MKKADISKIDWLLKNNIAWSEFYKNFSNTYNLLGKQKKDFYRFTGCDRSTFPFKENKMSSFPLVPIFSGNIVSLKYANKVTYDDVQESIKNLYEWIYNNIIKTDKGISIVKSSKNSIYCKYSSYQPFSNFIVDDIFHQSYDIFKHETISNILSKCQNKCEYYNHKFCNEYLYLDDLFTSKDILLNEQCYLGKKYHVILNNKNELRYKFNNVNSFGFGCSSLILKSYLNSFKNFPKHINKNFLIYNMHLGKSFKGFPKEILNDSYFVNCLFDKTTNLDEVNTHIYGNLIHLNL